MTRPKSEKKEKLVYDETYLTDAYSNTKEDFEYYEKVIIDGLEKGFWDKDEFEFAIELCELRIKLNNAENEEAKKKVIDESEFNEYIQAMLCDQYLPHYDFFGIGAWGLKSKNKISKKKLLGEDYSTDGMIKHLELLKKYLPR